jgi:hypothetical protein
MIFNDLFITTLNPRSTTAKANTLISTPPMRFYLVYVTDQIPCLFQILCSPMYLFLIVYLTYIENKYLNSLINSWYVSYPKGMHT